MPLLPRAAIFKTQVGPFYALRVGLVLRDHFQVVVHAADIQDREGAKRVLEPLRRRFTRLRLIVADAIYNGGIADWVGALRTRNRLAPGNRREASRGEPV